MRLQYYLLALLIDLLLVASQIPPNGIPLTIKKSSTHTVLNNFPASVVVPLPYGFYQTTTLLSVVTGEGFVVPSQIDVQSRWFLKDQSIREIRCHFVVSMSSEINVTTYYLKELSNPNSAFTDSIGAIETETEIQVKNGFFNFIVSKQNFLLSDVFWNDSLIMNSLGGIFTDKYGQVFKESDLVLLEPPIIEENGPIRVVLYARVDASLAKCTVIPNLACSKYNICDTTLPIQVRPGYAIRIYAYAYNTFIRVEYQLTNSIPTLVGHPLYFRELKIRYQANIYKNNSTITSLGVNCSPPGTPNVQILQGRPNNNTGTWVIEDQSILSNVEVLRNTRSTNGSTKGWLDITGSDESFGVFSMIRNYWETFPNSIDINNDEDVSQSTIDIGLYPLNGGMWTSSTVPDPTGLYWVDDMQHVVKEYAIWVHGDSTTQQEMQDMADNLQWYPVTVIPLSWYADTSVTLNLGGYVPRTDPTTSSDVRTPTDNRLYEFRWNYNAYHWSNFGSIGSQCFRPTDLTEGGANVVQIIPSQQSVYYYLANDIAMGELNTRPQSFHPGYRAYINGTENMSPNPYCNPSWRYWCGGFYAKSLSRNPYPGYNATADEGIGSMNQLYQPRFSGILAFDHIIQGYSITGNLWMRDWFKWIIEFAKGQHIFWKTTAYVIQGPSGVGNAVNTIVSGIRIWGNVNGAADDLKKFIRETSFRYQDQEFGHYYNYASDFSRITDSNDGYLMESYINWMEENSDPQVWAESFQLLSGLISCNMNYRKFGFSINLDSITENESPVLYSLPSSSSSYGGVDPHAWYYLHTGDEDVRSLTLKYIRTGVLSASGVAGETPYGCSPLTNPWTGGAKVCRLARELLVPMDNSTRPSAVSDLQMSLDSNGVIMTLQWTTPYNSAKFHILWSDRPISASANRSKAVTNWWAANPIGPSINVNPGTSQQLKINLTATTLATSNNGSFIYAAMFTWDDKWNMSPMSNVASNDPSFQTPSIAVNSRTQTVSFTPKAFNATVGMIISPDGLATTNTTCDDHTTFDSCSKVIKCIPDQGKFIGNFYFFPTDPGRVTTWNVKAIFGGNLTKENRYTFTAVAPDGATMFLFDTDDQGKHAWLGRASSDSEGLKSFIAKDGSVQVQVNADHTDPSNSSNLYVDTVLINCNYVINTENAKTSHFQRNITIIVVVLGVTIILALSVIIMLLLMRRGKERSRRRSALLPAISMQLTIKRIQGVKVLNRIGGGNFGEVFKGLAYGDTLPVALKSLHPAEYDAFMSEALISDKLIHPNCVLFLGMFVDEITSVTYLVSEFCSEGSLLSYLNSNVNTLTISQMLQFCDGAAKGMAFLESQQIVHRDLACRNLLLSKGVVKVADFGMSRAMSQDEYSKKGGNIPVRWTAPEIMMYGKYSSKSDSWSMGITFNEMLTYGLCPFHTKSNLEVVQLFCDQDGPLFEKPVNCPVDLWTIIEDKRPHKTAFPRSNITPDNRMY